MIQAMTRFFTIVFFLLISAGVIAQQGSIRGVVKSEKGEPLPMATVQLESTKQTSLTDESGVFNFQNIKPGNYKLLITIIGYDLAVKKVTVTAGQEASVDVKLNEGSLEL